MSGKSCGNNTYSLGLALCLSLSLSLSLCLPLSVSLSPFIWISQWLDG